VGEEDSCDEIFLKILFGLMMALIDHQEDCHHTDENPRNEIRESYRYKAVP